MLKMKNAWTSRWMRHAGVAAFLFFFVKGLVWLGIAAAGLIAIL